MSFWEFFIVGVIGLIVIGPDKLPQTIKTGLTWISRVKRLLNDTRSEFEKQLGVDEIKREIHNEQVMASLKSLKVVQENIKKETDALNREVIDVQKSTHDDALDNDSHFGEQQHNHPPADNSAVDANPAPQKSS